MKHKTVKNRIFRLVLAFLLLIAVGLGSLAYSIVEFGNRDEKCHADVAIVLGASVTDDGVSPVLRERLNHGIWLYQNGYVGHLILTGGVGEGDTLSEAWVSRQYVLAQACRKQRSSSKKPPKSPKKIWKTPRRLWIRKIGKPPSLSATPYI